MPGSEKDFDLEMMRNGSPEQRAAVINQFRDYLRNLAREEFKGVPQDDLSVSGFVQRTIIQADQRIEQCHATDAWQFKEWLKEIMIHEILNRRKYLKRVKKESGSKGDANSLMKGMQDSAHQNAVFEEEKAVLMSAMESLTPENQSVILARHRDNLTFAQIGERLNCSAEEVRALWNRAIKQLSGILRSSQKVVGDERN